MDILYMGYFCNEDLFNILVEKGSKSSHARQQFERKLISGLMQNMEEHSMQLISYLPLVDNELVHMIGEEYGGNRIDYLWCKKNVFDILRAIKKNLGYIKKWCEKSGEDKVILTYSANPLHCIPALLLRRKYGYKIVTISSEISIYRRSASNNFFARMQRNLSYYLENNFDGYVLLSEHMNEVINLKKHPYIVVEGFAEIDDKRGEVCSPDKREHVILYAGGLSEDNGIKILVEGFKKAELQGWELWICGSGVLEGYVRRQSEQDSQIKYWGIIPNQKVRNLEKQVSFLINPRFSGEDYTKYSFPSKTLEYMSTGTPTILTLLKGIPKDYFRYSIVLEDESIDGIASLFKSITKVPYGTWEKLGRDAAWFVNSSKGPNVQGKKIIDFIYNLSR